MSVATVFEFLERLEKSELLSAEQIEQVRRWPDDDPNAFASRLVEQGLLTKWQTQQLLAGKVQFMIGKYKLIDMIGVGGMGAVYKAVQNPIGRIVALKVMNRAVLKQPKAVTRFLREIRSAAAVDHPNVVRAYDANVEKRADIYYLVMEFVDGENLKTWIRKGQGLPIGWSCECIRQAALGLEHAFEQGMVHRDIKPSNLLVTEDEHSGLPQVKILDLGLARFATETPDEGDLTRSGQVLGTPDYIAPEQARNTKGADIRADIFSLGCTLFELLTGRLPFPGETVMEKLMARATEDAPRLRSVRPDVPEGLDEVVVHMLARDPNARYATPGEVARALAPYALGTAGSAAQSASAVQQTDRNLNDFHLEMSALASSNQRSDSLKRVPPWQQPRYRAAAGLVVAVLLFGLIWSFTGGRKPNSSTASTQPPKTKKSGAPSGDQHPEEGGSSEGSSADPERAAALWVLRSGGRVSFESGSRPQTGKSPTAGTKGHQASAPADLPAGQFQLTGIEFPADLRLLDSDFERLAKLPHLSSLVLTGTRFGDSDLAPLRELETLTHLDLADTATTDTGAAFVKSLPKLKDLSFSRTKITGAALDSLRSAKGLSELSLAGTKINDGDLRHLTEMPELTYLNLAETAVNGPGLQNLTKLKHLDTIDLGGLPLRNRALQYLRGLTSVHSLRLTRAKVTDGDLPLLSGMTNLRELVLASTQVTGDGMKYLTWMAELERLDVQETFVGDGGLKSIKDLTSLKELRLRRTLVGDKGVEFLRGLRSLEVLELSETKVTRPAVDALQQALPNCKIEF